MAMQVALGFRAHSGWAAMVAVAGTSTAPEVLDRRRILMTGLDGHRGNQPYHAAAEMALAQAEQHVRRAIESARNMARSAIETAIGELRTQGREAVAAGIVRAAGRPLPDLAGILASHALIHSAEGELYRDALAWASAECGLRVGGIREKEIDAAVLKRLGSLAKSLGPPWTLDQKHAAAAALTLL